MRYIKTYEGLFDFFKKKITRFDGLTKKTIEKECELVSEEIVDSMLDIFDDYNIHQLGEDIKQIPKTGIYWYYNYRTIYEDSDTNQPHFRNITDLGMTRGVAPLPKSLKIKCGVSIHTVEGGTSYPNFNHDNKQVDIKSILRDIKKLLPVISSRTGVKLNVHDDTSYVRTSRGTGYSRMNIIIDFSNSLKFLNFKK